MTTRTYGSVHFTDLESGRFEMLAMQIIYRMRRWMKIDHVGAGGSDDGIDISAEELLENGKRVIHHFQCKRYEKLNKSQVVKIIKDYIAVNPARPDYYYLVCGCNPSKTAIDAFDKICNDVGIKNAYIWSASYLETLLYWSLGRDVAQLQAESKWGSGFIRQLSKDLQHIIPNAKGLSRTNILYMINFYKLFPFDEIVPQVGGQFKDSIVPQDDGQIAEPGVELINAVFSIPWGHHKLLIDKCGKDHEKASFYVQQTLVNNWSRAVLLNWLDTDLYERQGKAITNFTLTLPEPQSDLAQEMTRDPYNFDFLTIRARYDEKELKDALMDNVQRLLMELGSGFAFIGREYRLVVGSTEQFIDLLFYNYRLHCFVVVEVKVTDFDPRDMGQLGTYVAAVDGILRKEGDQPTIGLLICKTKDNVLAQYAANVMNAPIGISEYQLNNLMKDEFKGTLPTIEELERELGGND